MFRQLWRYTYTLAGLIFRRPLVGVAIIGITPEGSIVLVRRRDNDQWALPGGLVDWGETIAQAAARELKEETGFTLKTIRRLVGVYSQPHRDPRIHSVCVTVVAEVAEAANTSMPHTDVLEISEVRAIAPDALPLGKLSHDHDRQLQDYLNGTTTIA
jgi:ADP-ribose pyrophosphatase YjhB (NUDIX family)